MRFAIEQTSFMPKGIRPTRLEHPLFKNLEAASILLIVATCLLCAPPDIPWWIQVWRITCHFGEHESATLANTKVQESKSQPNRKSKSQKILKSRYGKV